MENSKLIEVVDRYYKNMSPFIREGEVGDVLQEILHILKTLEGAKEPKKNGTGIEIFAAYKELKFLYTKLTLRAERAEKMVRLLTTGGSERDFTSAVIEGKKLRIKVLEKQLTDIRGRAGVEKIKHICKQIVSWGCEHNEDTETMIDKQAQALSKMINDVK